MHEIWIFLAKSILLKQYENGIKKKIQELCRKKYKKWIIKKSPHEIWKIIFVLGSYESL